jgi:hypothetical protein
MDFEMEDVRSLFEVVRFLIELIVLALIYYEIRSLRKHERTLREHEEQLTAVRPLYSTLYNDSDQVRDLSISFVREAKEIYAIGSISNLLKTEKNPHETDQQYRERVATVDPKTIEHITSTRDFILSGKKYRRIMDFNPTDSSSEAFHEILCNVTFFRRIMELDINKIDLQLFHNPEILKGPGDFHFKCSDRQVVFRAGGHGNEYTNIAISITDTRVLHEYQNYYQSLIRSESTRRLDQQHLEQLEELLSTRDVHAVRNYLSVI